MRDAIAQRAIDIIEQRTQSGRGANGRKFKQYSKEYAEEKGVPRSAVDLTLSGDMLGLIDVVGETRDKIEFGWDDETENAKAFNHIKGDTVPKRDFFDLTKKELTSLRAFAEELLDDE
ncbi:MAG: hypothetical protein ACPGES_03745 [Coraliomargarita sp.]